MSAFVTGTVSLDGLEICVLTSRNICRLNASHCQRKQCPNIIMCMIRPRNNTCSLCCAQVSLCPSAEVKQKTWCSIK